MGSHRDQSFSVRKYCIVPARIQDSPHFCPEMPLVTIKKSVENFSAPGRKEPPIFVLKRSPPFIQLHKRAAVWAGSLWEGPIAKERIMSVKLPKLIDTYIKAHNAYDADTALACLSENATVLDEGETRKGTSARRSRTPAVTCTPQLSVTPQ